MVPVPDTTPAGSNIFNYRAGLICDPAVNFFVAILAFYCLMPTTFQIVPVLVLVLDTTLARSNILNCRAALICGFFIQYYHTILAFYSSTIALLLGFYIPASLVPACIKAIWGP